ncbi:hypothetical protein SLEP1_g30544 [Rubroshorea leprosula]|uniref:Uncharacterized protein n=1 Tax=Rubroshorea leprosula TaxID=152421 RepID=A0AAV5K6H4_9ROSI|nr:hypothetical protein SLEP1_g30544 [Rubroshorea leprosula]
MCIAQYRLGLASILFYGIFGGSLVPVWCLFGQQIDQYLPGPATPQHMVWWAKGSSLGSNIQSGSSNSIARTAVKLASY